MAELRRHGIGRVPSSETSTAVRSNGQTRHFNNRTFEVLSHLYMLASLIHHVDLLCTNLLEDLRESSRIYLNELLPTVSWEDTNEIADRTWSLFKSLPNCWKPSSRVTKLADIFEACELLACMTFFLSRSVLRRSLSYGKVS